MRGNILWDALKFLWQHRADARTYFVAGWIAVTLVIPTIVQKLRGISPDWYIIAILSLFSLISIIIGAVITRRSKKNVSAETLKPSDVSTLEVEARCPDPSIHELAKRSKEDIRWYVLVPGCSISFRYLNNIDPYIIFTFSIYNASIYDISFDSKAEGYISFDNQKLGGNKDLTSNLNVFSYGSNSYIKITQYLSDSAAAAIKRAEEANQGMFKLDNLIIKFSGKDIEPTELKLPEGVYTTGILYP
ncbi:MAG TPA: hypothetical protein VF553_06385 [Pyrinomonadaceae bacterium]